MEPRPPFDQLINLKTVMRDSDDLWAYVRPNEVKTKIGPVWRFKVRGSRLMQSWVRQSDVERAREILNVQRR